MDTQEGKLGPGPAWTERRTARLLSEAVPSAGGGPFPAPTRCILSSASTRLHRLLPWVPFIKQSDIRGEKRHATHVGTTVKDQDFSA